MEVDGAQHFHYVPHFHKSQLGFMRQKEWDRKKNSFCLMHRIPLIRIPYWDIENLTLNDIFTNKTYRVTNKDHNILLAKREVRK